MQTDMQDESECESNLINVISLADIMSEQEFNRKYVRIDN